MIGHEQLYISQYGVTVEQIMDKYGRRYRLKIEDGAIQVPVGGSRKKLESDLKLDAQIAGTGIYAPEYIAQQAAARAAKAASAPTPQPVRPSASHRCHFCGGTWAVTKVYDMSGIPGYVCGRHSRDFAEGLGNFA